MVNDKEKEGGSDDVSKIPIGNSESRVHNNRPTTPLNNGGNNSEENERKENSTLNPKATTPFTINTNSSRLHSEASGVSLITTSTVRQLIPPLETNEIENENVDVSVESIPYETLDDGHLLVFLRNQS